MSETPYLGNAEQNGGLVAETFVEPPKLYTDLRIRRGGKPTSLEGPERQWRTGHFSGDIEVSPFLIGFCPTVLDQFQTRWGEVRGAIVYVAPERPTKSTTRTHAWQAPSASVERSTPHSNDSPEAYICAVPPEGGEYFALARIIATTEVGIERLKQLRLDTTKETIDELLELVRNGQH
jgi:hypothetical protein